ncbi:MAG: helix-turn-helix transcriptional regulator [Planctomycetota bacterium]|jgi:transcriptional regulator with XRE-family HTH domain|nr:helix-turn-helix transcriptional regulator [Planctomycetota bacterium]
MTYLGQYIRKKRLAADLKVSKLAALIGYKNLNKGCGKVRGLENEGYFQSEEFLSKVAAALNIDHETLDTLIQKDIEAYEAWEVANPVQPHLVLRYMAAVYSRCALPDSITTLDESIRFASAKAVERKLRVCLVWSRRLSIYFDREGQEEGRSEEQPWMVVNGKRFLLRSSKT